MERQALGAPDVPGQRVATAPAGIAPVALAAARARELFEQVVAGVPPGAAGRLTPCPGWTVADVVHHVATLEPARHLLRDLGASGDDVLVVEFTVHAWDVATAVGRSLVVPEPLIRAGLEVLEPLAADLAGLRAFGYGAVDAPGTTSTQTWLLHLTGRRP